MKKLLLKSLLLLCALIVGTSSVWATAKSNVSTVTTKFSATGDVTNKFTQSGTFTSASWNLAVTWPSTGESWNNLDSSKGTQIGSGSKPATSIVLTGSGFSGTISSIVVNTSGASSINATVGVSVGSTAFLNNSNETASLTSSAADYTFTGSASGNVVITWTNSSSKAIYIKSITVNFDDGSSQTTTTVSFPQASYTTTFGSSFTAPTPTCNSDGTKTYSSSNTDVADVNATTGALTIKKAGKTTITLNVAENSSYTSGSASYELRVEGVIEDGIIDFGNLLDYGSGLTANAGIATTASTWTSGNVSMAVAGRNQWTETQLRLYKINGDDAAGNITISVPDGYVMTRIDLEGGTNLNLTTGGGFKSGTVWSGKSQSVKFTHNGGNGNLYLTKITVQYRLATEATIDITMGSEGYMTYYNYDVALSFGSLEAFVVSAVGTGDVTLTPITKAPAGTPVILKGTAGAKTLTVESTPVATGTNKLKISDGTATSNAYTNVYALAKKGTEVLFHLVQAGVYVPSGKCYITTAASAAREYLGFVFGDDETTGLNEAKTQKLIENGEYYNLAGQRVAQPTKGLYIVNGKKVIIK